MFASGYRKNAAIGAINTGAASEGLSDLIFAVKGNANAGEVVASDERMRITSSGYVGIGKTPATALDVNGTITGTAKNFDIPHPTLPGYRLVHSTLEGPEIAVFYRGEAQLVEGSATVVLPSYFDALTRDRSATVNLTAKGAVPFSLSYDRFDEKSFVVHGSILNGAFDWEVKATRDDQPPLTVEKLSPS